jgi:hypothetical protein
LLGAEQFTTGTSTYSACIQTTVYLLTGEIIIIIIIIIITIKYYIT